MTLNPNANWTAEIAKQVTGPIYFMRLQGLPLEKVTDPGLGTWSSASDLTSWVEATGTGGAVARESTNPFAGSFCAKLTFGTAGNPSLKQSGIVLPLSTRVFGAVAFRLGAAIPAGQLRVRIHNATTGNYLQADGVTWGATVTGPTIEVVSTDWRTQTVEFTTEATGASFDIEVLMTTAGWANGEFCFLGWIGLHPFPGDFSTGPVDGAVVASRPYLNIPEGGETDFDPLTGRFGVAEYDVELTDDDAGAVTALVTAEVTGTPIATLVNHQVTLYGGYRSLQARDYPAIFTGRIVNLEAMDRLLGYKLSLAGSTRLLEGMIMTGADQDHLTTIQGNVVNVVWAILTGIFSTTDPDFPLTVVSTDTGSTAAPTGLDIDRALLNETLMKTQRDIWHGSDPVRIEIGNPTSALEYLQTEFGRTFHAFFPIGGDGRIGVRFITPAAPPTSAVALDITDHIIAVRGWRRRLDQHINRVAVWGDFDLDTGAYLTELYTIEDTANQTQTEEIVTYTIESKWLRSDQGGVRIAAELASRILARYKPGPVEVEIDVTFTRRNVEEGDVVEITHPDLPNLLTGARGVVSQRMFVLSVRPRLAEGVITLKCIDTGFSARYGVIGPSSLTASYDSATAQQRAAYAFIGDAANKVGAALEPGYNII